MRILVVVDMQNDFVSGALGTPEAREIVPCVVGRVVEGLNRGETILFTRDTHEEDYLGTQEGRKLPVPHCIRGTAGWQLDATVAAALQARDYTAVEKPTFGSVVLPGLMEKAAGGERFTIEMAGLCTDICVVSNALLLKAYFPEAPISVDAACCAGVTPESHRAALATLRSCQIDVAE